MKQTFYITTPIYYPSNKFTLGNCYTTVICDAVARFNKCLGKEVFFLTGTDEHGQKIQKVAHENGMTELEYLDKMIADSKELWKMLNIDYDKFIRTTDEYHVKAIQKAFTTLYEKGHVYKSKYEGLYCTPCESFWTEPQLVNGKCPDCGREVIVTQEEAYFFKLSNFADKILKLYEENPNFLQPASRINEMINNFIKPGLQDLCVTRTTVKWGVSVPFDPNHTIYVWIDALLNYLTALGYNSDDDSLMKKFWPADVHIMGKEIVRFHAIIWPALLMALDIPLPKQVFGHGWLLFGGDKLSKSKDSTVKEVLDPHTLIPIYGADAIRYILLREIPFGSDGVYTTEKFLTRVNADLANDYGNLINRTFAMVKKYNNSVVPDRCPQDELGQELEDFVNSAIKNTKLIMESYDVSKALAEIFTIFSKANKYIDLTAPWVLAKNNQTEKLNNVLYNLLECINVGTKLLSPFLTECTQKVLASMNQCSCVEFDKMSTFGSLESGIVLNELLPLFPRIDILKDLEMLKEIANK